MSVHLANQSSELLTSSKCFTAIYRQIIGFRAGTTQVDDFPFNKQTKLLVEKKKRQSCACSPSYWQSTAHKGSTKLARFSRTNSCLPLREYCRGKTQNSNTNAAAAGTGGTVQQKTFFIIIFPQSRQKPGPKRVVYPPRWLRRAPGIEKKSIVVIVPLKNDSRENNRNDRRIPGPDPSATPGAEDN